MLSVEEWMDLKQLHQQGHSIRALAQMSGCSRNTVRRVLRETTPKPYQTPQRPSCLDPYKPYLLEREKTARLSAVRLLDELRPRATPAPSMCCAVISRRSATIRSATPR